MISRIFFTIVPISTIIGVSLANELLCPVFRKFSVSDIQHDHVEHEERDFEFRNLITPLEFNNYFRSSVVPNNGSFELFKGFHFTSFSTMGSEDASGQYYVSNFSIEIISSDSSYDDYKKTFTVDTHDEVYFKLYTVIPTEEIRITANDFVAPLAHPLYYWKMELFGCDEAELETTMNNQCSMISSVARSIITHTTTYSETITETVTGVCSADGDKSTISVSITSSSTLIYTMSGLQSSVVLTSPSIPSSSSIPSIQGGINVSTNIPIGSSSSSQSAYVSVGAFVGVILPLLLIIIVLITIFGIILVWLFNRKTKASSFKSIGRHKQDTLREINRNQLYQSSTQKRTTGHDDNLREAESVVMNRLYDSGSPNDQSEISPSQGHDHQDTNEYTSIDQYTNNYESVDQIHSHDGIQSNNNPAYSATTT